jgi:hypothetical protein
MRESLPANFWQIFSVSSSEALSEIINSKSLNVCANKELIVLS